MNSKERMRAAVARERVDKIPLGFYVVDYEIVERVIGHKTYVRNKVESQIAFWEGRRDEVVESYKKDTVDFYRKIDICDVICFKEAPIVPPRGYLPEDPPRQVSQDVWQDSRGRVYKVSHVSNEFVMAEDPTIWEGEYTVDRFKQEIEDVPPDPSIFEAVDYLTAELGHERYIAGSSGCPQTTISDYNSLSMPLLGGMERGLLAYRLHPDVVKAAIEYYRRWGNVMDKYYIRPGQDGVLFEEDTAGTRGPLISPKMYGELCYPALRSRIRNAKSFGKQIILHNCGNNRPLLGMFIDAGIDCYQSLQTNANMDVVSLQKEWGHAISFWGGVATELLIDGTREDVRRNVREVMNKAAPSGGFILGPSHSIAVGVKYDNFMTMLEEHSLLRDKYC